jgi:hypothetical protein
VEPALQVCRAVPGLANDAVGTELLTPLLVADEVDALSQGAPTLGLIQVGEVGLAELRSQVSCRVLDRTGDEVLIERTLPVVGPDGAITDALEVRQMGWRLLDDRVEIGLVDAQARWRRVEGADPEAVVAQLIAIERLLADPVLAVDLHNANLLADVHQAQMALTSTFVDARMGVVHAELINNGGRPIKAATVLARFESGASERVTVGPLAAGQRVPYTVQIPEGANGGVRLQVSGVELFDEVPR